MVGEAREGLPVRHALKSYTRRRGERAPVTMSWRVAVSC
jgi:hypothetical protein